MTPATRVHRHTTGQEGALVNAYLVETGEGVVAVDGTLTVSDGRALRRQLEELGKPLLAVLVTHAHPDHYGGIAELVAGDDVPVVATSGVDAVIRRDDAVKEEILRPMFGEEWPRERTFPSRTVADGETLELGGASFTVIDLGPGESPHDSIWLLGDERRDGVPRRPGVRRQARLPRRRLPRGVARPPRAPSARSCRPRRLSSSDTADLSTHAHFEKQREYIETFVDAVRSANWSQPETARAAVVERMTRLLPTDELQFLMELSIDPVAARIGVAQPV